MDDLYPLNHRKRKADNDDPPANKVPGVPQDTLLPDPAQSSSSSTPGPSNAPRQPWLTGTSNADDALWATSKRPRLEIAVPSRIPGRKSVSRRSPIKRSPSPRSPTLRHACCDLEEVPAGPSSGFRALPFDLSPIPTPPLVPLINRQTLKELDLDAILRNPQLRHDLLFDPGLQFRPTSSRRKRDLSEKYWAAVVQEIENGCTCVSFDSQGKTHLPVLCICSHSDISPSSPTLHQVQPDVFTSHMPSRIPPLLTEFLEVLLLVIQPLCTISGVYVNPGTFKAQMQEHSAQATYIRSLFDPVLIEQELKHGVFNPGGLFRTIGNTLKGHCAPMRDRFVEAMVQAAETCGSNPKRSSSKDAIRAIRMCMEILELMKLDIANHQLQTLRPFLIRTSGQFELRSLKTRHGSDAPLSTTREWIEAAHMSLIHSRPIFHPTFAGQSLQYSALSRNQQLYISIVKGLVDLVFNPPLTSASSLSPPTNSPPASPTVPSVSTPLPLFPETLYLDNQRMLLLSSDAADATALYMFLLLYRQLVFSENSNSGSSHTSKILTDADMVRMKNEIRDISGAFRLGSCFSRNQNKIGNKEGERWRVVKEDVVLQIASRASDVTKGASAAPAPIPFNSTSAPSSACSLPGSASLPLTESVHSSPSSSSSSLPSSSSHSPASSASPTSSPWSSLDENRSVPNSQTVGLGQKWVDAHMQAESALSAMLHNRLRDVVFNAVLISTYPGRDLTNGCRPITSLDLSTVAASNRTNTVGSAVGNAVGTVSGMEPLSDEIRTLVEKISLLALIHLNAYLPLYEKEGFVPSS